MRWALTRIYFTTSQLRYVCINMELNSFHHNIHMELQCNSNSWKCFCYGMLILFSSSSLSPPHSPFLSLSPLTSPLLPSHHSTLTTPLSPLSSLSSPLSSPPSPPLPPLSSLLPLSPQVLQGLSGHLPETLKGFAAAANLSPETKVHK